MLNRNHQKTIRKVRRITNHVTRSIDACPHRENAMYVPSYDWPVLPGLRWYPCAESIPSGRVYNQFFVSSADSLLCVCGTDLSGFLSELLENKKNAVSSVSEKTDGSTEVW